MSITSALVAVSMFATIIFGLLAFVVDRRSPRAAMVLVRACALMFAFTPIHGGLVAIGEAKYLLGGTTFAIGVGFAVLACCPRRRIP